MAVTPRLGGPRIRPGDAMSSLADGLLRAIDKQLAVYDAFDVGAFVCCPRWFDPRDGGGRWRLHPRRCHPVLADAGVARRAAHRRRDVVVRRRHPARPPHGSRHVRRATGKPLDGAIAARSTACCRAVVTPRCSVCSDASPRTRSRSSRSRWRGRGPHRLRDGRSSRRSCARVRCRACSTASTGRCAAPTIGFVAVRGFLDAVLDRAADGFSHRRRDLPGHRRPHGEIGWRGTGAVRAHSVAVPPWSAICSSLHDFQGGAGPRPPLPRDRARGRQGRDLRLLLITVGAVGGDRSVIAARGADRGGSAYHLDRRGTARRSWWATGPCSAYAGVRAVALDFDGTVLISGLPHEAAVGACAVVDDGLRRTEAARQYLATAGLPFATQLDEIAPGRRGWRRWPAVRGEKTLWMGRCAIFADVVPPSSASRRPRFRSCCAAHQGAARPRVLRALRAAPRFASVEGWRAGHPKSVQL